MYKRNKSSNRAKARNLKRLQRANIFLSLLLIISVLFIASRNLEAQSVKGKISGKLVDAETGSPLIGANVIIQGTNMDAASDYRYLNEDLNELSANFILPFTQWSGRKSILKFGALYSKKNIFIN
jgi:hypothetical protein